MSPIPTNFLRLFPILVLCLNVNNIAEAKNTNSFVRTTSHKQQIMRQKLSHLHFYFHDVVSGSNATAVRVTQPPNPSSRTVFGMITMIDDLLTSGPDPKASAHVGRAQGMYASACQDELGFLQAMNLYFTAGKYNGSVLTVLGRNAPMHPVREMPVIGGSGLFRFATGYALAKTHWLDFSTGDAIVEYNVTVLHY